MEITVENLTDQGTFFHGKVIYDLPEEMIETHGASQAGFASVLVNDLNLEFDESGRFFSIWGYLPKSGWNKEVVPLPAFVRGIVRVDSEIAAGSSLRVTKVGSFWPVNYDEHTGWIYVGESNLHGMEQSECIEIFENTILRVKAGSLIGLWMKPEIVRPS